MRARAQTVIVGGGIAGASIAYHLTRLGRRDVLVLEQGALVGGTTSHAPGLVGQLRSSPSLMTMLKYSASLYKRLAVDGAQGFRREGSLRLACSKGRLAQIQDQSRAARAVGLEVHLLDLRETTALFPFLSTAGVEGALYVPDDGSADASVLAVALIAAAGAGGARFRPHTRVVGAERRDGRVVALTTAAGRIELETLVIACGIWSPLVGRLAGVSIPLTPMRHQYLVTAPLPELAGRSLPNLRDPDGLFYARQRGRGLIVGGYERAPRPFNVGDIPDAPNPTVQPFDPEHFDPLLRNARYRIPLLSGVQIEERVNGLEAFTPDGEFLLGPAPEASNVWVACGFCAHGVSGAGGVGKVTAEWVVNGDPGLDLSAMALARFGGRELSREAIQASASEVYRTYYDLDPGE